MIDHRGDIIRRERNKFEGVEYYSCSFSPLILDASKDQHGDDLEISVNIR